MEFLCSKLIMPQQTAVAGNVLQELKDEKSHSEPER